MIIESKMSLGEVVRFPGEELSLIPTEQMVRAMSWERFYENKMLAACYLTENAILNGIDSHWWKNREFWTIDSRVHMLMKDWYPCIPGWHHDDVPRTRVDKQPNYADELRCEHAMFLLNAHVAPTEFAIGTADFDEPCLGETIYEQWDRDVRAEVSAGALQAVSCPDSQWVYFNDRTWHRGVQCQVDFGHRLFIRIGMNYRMIDGEKVYVKPEKWSNEIRRNAQVYMEYPNKGW